MAGKAEITMRLAARLKEERKEKGLSLDALANLSGVSRSMLSQIERGQSSPTVASLWNLTRALNVDFAALLDQEIAPLPPIREVLTAAQTPVIEDHIAGCSIRILSAADDVGVHEVYDIRFKDGGALISDAHKNGCVEYLTVIEGGLTIMSNGAEATISAGDTIRYAADVAHSIQAAKAARALLIVKNS